MSSIIISFIGAIVTLATVIFTLIINKRDSLSAKAAEKKAAVSSTPVWDHQIHSSLRFIDRMKALLGACLWFLLAFVILLIPTIVFEGKLHSCPIPKVITILDIVALSGCCIFFILLVIVLRKEITIK